MADDGNLADENRRLRLKVTRLERKAGVKKPKPTGGARDGAGRPTLFEGEREKVTYRLTSEIAKEVRVVAEDLVKQGVFPQAYESVAAEFLIRKALGKLPKSLKGKKKR